jgi:hypothetical protein
MSLISITVDGQVRSIESDQRPTQIFAEDKEIVVCTINGVLKDLWTDLNDGDVVTSVSISSPEGLAVLRHSTAHVMAQAVQQVFADTKLGIGPPITDGFYYDFDPQNPFNPDDLEKIDRFINERCGKQKLKYCDFSELIQSARADIQSWNDLANDPLRGLIQSTQHDQPIT